MSKSKTATASKQVATAATSKANAKRTAQPGIISTIMLLLIAAREAKKPTTTSAMLTALSSKFADRAPTGLLVTLRAQLSRLPHERKFGIAKRRDGATVYYCAANGATADAKRIAA